MVANFVAGGAAINVIARQVGASVQVVDVGVAGDVAALPGVEHRKVRAGTADLAHGPAMTVAEARGRPRRRRRNRGRSRRAGP